MTYNCKLAIFDLDGTLLDTSKGIILSVKTVIKNNNLKELSDTDLLSYIGPPIQNSFKSSYNYDDNKCQQLANEFRDIYKNIFLYEAIPYEGIYELLDYLNINGIEIAVATYKREDYALDILRRFGFDKYSSNLHGADNSNVLKKSDIIELCISNSLVKDKSKITYIGDTPSDLIAAKETKVSFIGVNYGFGFKEVSGYANKPLDIEELMR